VSWLLIIDQVFYAKRESISPVAIFFFVMGLIIHGDLEKSLNKA